MKKMKSIIAILMLSIIGTSCSKNEKVSPSGNVKSIEYSYKGITGIDVSNGFTGNIYIDSNERVVIKSDDNLHSCIHLNFSGSIVYVGLNDNTNISGSPTLVADFYVKSLNSIRVTSGSSVLNMDTIYTERMNMVTSEGSSLNAAIVCDDMSTKVSSGSSNYLTGATDYLNAEIHDGSRFENFAFNTNDLVASLSSGSHMSLTINNSISITAIEGSSLRYQGNATVVHQNLKSGSSITKH